VGWAGGTRSGRADVAERDEEGEKGAKVLILKCEFLKKILLF
jgi:hypothetical protein